MSASRVVHVLSDQHYDLHIGREMRRYGLKESFWANCRVSLKLANVPL